MIATRVTFHRLHKFVENGVAFTPEQIAKASYVVMVGSPGQATQTFPVPASIVAATAPSASVIVPFTQLGFKPTPGVEYHVQVVCMLDGLESPASPAVTFANSLTPAGVDSVSVS